MSTGGGKGRKVWLLVGAFLLTGGAAYLVGVRLLASRHYRAAQAAIERRDFTRAGEHLKKCLACRPGDLAARLLAARTARRQGDYEAARHHLTIYKQQEGAAEALSLEHQLLRLHQGDLQEAASLLEICTERPEAPDALLILEAFIEGHLKALQPAFQQGMTTAGTEAAPFVAHLQQAIDLWLRRSPAQPDQVQGLVWRSKAHAMANDAPKSLADVRAALELDPSHFQARLQLALCLVPQAPAEAAAQLEILRQRFPEDRQPRFFLATVRRALGQLDQARELLDELLASLPDALPVLLERGRVALDAEQPQEAERFLRRALALSPEHPEVHLTLSRCLHLAGKEDEARRHREEARRLKEDRRR